MMAEGGGRIISEALLTTVREALLEAVWQFKAREGLGLLSALAALPEAPKTEPVAVRQGEEG